MIYNLGNFDHFTQSGFSVIPKSRIANFCKPINKVIIFPVSSDPLNLKIVERKGKLTEN